MKERKKMDMSLYFYNWVPLFIKPKLNSYINEVIPSVISRRKIV